MAYIFVGNSDIVLFGKSLPISFVAAHHPGHRGVIPARGESFPPQASMTGEHSRRGVIHASDTVSPLERVGSRDKTRVESEDIRQNESRCVEDG